MDRIAQMLVFQRVAELGSFSRCAEQLGLPKATVSDAVQQLEKSLGNRLLHRTTRKVELTQDGQSYFHRCVEILADFDELQMMFQPQDQQLRGTLRVDMPIGIAKDLVLPQLENFLSLHPELHLQLSSTDQKVDLVAEGFDAVIRVGTLADSSLVARSLGVMQQVNCVSAAYIKRFGIPQTLAELSQHRLVNYSQQLSGNKATFDYLHEGKELSIVMQTQITVNNSEAYTAACLAGLGIIQVPLAGVKTQLERADLLQILPEHNPPPMPISLLYPNRKTLSRKIRVFMQWLEQLSMKQ
ncbi:LysR family transcriptional regulator [Nitrincola iocasae]|uniref:LysR family transcriptional regulator n=1 Tax=Nitrincola iocasae TaxID=2614693 RepID=A0A5J6LFZ6_9GAMM|nr:LysR family transcriptional regulator [Nitrincola iocasae]QEW07131.1 LysR family transcriptional regulator [Nitrincola iocasae]